MPPYTPPTPFAAKRTSSYGPNSTTASRRISTHGHIMAGTGGLPTHHSHSAPSSAHPNSTSSSSSVSQSAKDNKHFLQKSSAPFSIQAARYFPGLMHGSPGRRYLLLVVVIGGFMYMIHFMSSATTPGSWDLQRVRSGGNSGTGAPASSSAVIYKNEDGTEMDPLRVKAMISAQEREKYMVRDFGSKCQVAFETNKYKSPLFLQGPPAADLDRDRNQKDAWPLVTRKECWDRSLDWKRSLSKMLPNWKEHSPNWVGRGILLTAFKDGQGAETMPNLLVQLKLLRGLTLLPIEVWVERLSDITVADQEIIHSLGGTLRYFDDQIVYEDGRHLEGFVKSSDVTEPQPPAVNPAIRLKDIESLRPSQHNIKALTIAAMINTGFEDFVYYSPSTLPLHSPMGLFRLPEYASTGAIFWQSPNQAPAYDSPIWATIATDCDATSLEQSWSSVVLNHRNAWKGLFLAWHWLTTETDSAFYQSLLGREGRDLLRLSWLAIRRKYYMVPHLRASDLLDQGRIRPDGIGCDTNGFLYANPVAIENARMAPKKWNSSQQQQYRAYQASMEKLANVITVDGTKFHTNLNVMMVDTANSLLKSGSGSKVIFNSLNRELVGRGSTMATQTLVTDSFVAGPGNRVCVDFAWRRKGHTH